MPFESAFASLAEPKEEPWCLAFTNTVSSRHHPNGRDRFKSTEDLRTWLLSNHVLNQGAPNTGEDPRTLERAVRLREAVYRIAIALSNRQEPASDDIGELNWNVQKAVVAAQIEADGDTLKWNVESLRGSIAGCLGLIALSAAGLFTSEKASHVRECGNDECGWLFLDLSKNHSRKWCDMADCGNVAKARRYYAKKKALRTAGA